MCEITALYTLPWYVASMYSPSSYWPISFFGLHTLLKSIILVKRSDHWIRANKFPDAFVAAIFSLKFGALYNNQSSLSFRTMISSSSNRIAILYFSTNHAKRFKTRQHQQPISHAMTSPYYFSLFALIPVRPYSRLIAFIRL